MGKTIAEKILARAGNQEEVEAGEIVNASVDMAMSHDNAALVSKVFKSIGVDKVWDPSRIFLILDHRAPANSIKTAEGHKTIREFVTEQNIKYFYDVGEGICHQVMPEKGFVRPGMLIVGTDSHTTTYGAFGAFSTGIGASEMAAVWATGELWLKVPESMKITLTGEIPRRVAAKDVILKIIGDIGADGATYDACEFYGDTVDRMSIASRMCLSNQAMEAGAKAAIVPPDEKTIKYVTSHSEKKFHSVYADDDAVYAKTYDLDVADLVPQIACPHSVDNVTDISDVTGLHVDQAVLGSCTNGRLEDLAAAADILRNRHIAEHVRMIVIPASKEIYLQALKKGYIQTFLDAGGIVINPGCGPCLGAHQGILAAGERVISSTNRNFKGRMGSPETEVYLGSPATVAASAVSGEITDPREV